MWDLDQIVRQNNQVAIDNMMRGRVVDVAQSPQPKVWTLSLLARKLQIGPPLLTSLLDSFTSYDTLKGFIDIVREFLPEHEDEILPVTADQRVYQFCYFFSKKYYPIPTYRNQDTIERFMGNMPVELMGMSYSAYHGLDMRTSYLLLLSLVIYPYEGDDRDEEDDVVAFDPRSIEDNGKFKPSQKYITWLRTLVTSLKIGGVWTAPMGFSITKVADDTIQLSMAKNTSAVKETIRRTFILADKAGITAKFSRGGRTSKEKMSGARVPLLVGIEGIVGADAIKLIPQNGWTREELHMMTDNTPYDGVGHFADWACSKTGCIVLDANYGSCDYIEGEGEPYFRWTKHNVEILAAQWSKVQEYRTKIDRMALWLEASPIIHFRELLDFLNNKAKSLPERGELFEYDGDDYCGLDQYFAEEEDD